MPPRRAGRRDSSFAGPRSRRGPARARTRRLPRMAPSWRRSLSPASWDGRSLPRARQEHRPQRPAERGRGRALRRAPRAAAGDAALRRRLPDAEPDRGHARPARRPRRLHRRQALQDAAARRTRAVVYGLLTLSPPDGEHRAAGLHVVPALRRALRAAARPRCGSWSTPKGCALGPGEALGPRGVRLPAGPRPRGPAGGAGASGSPRITRRCACRGAALGLVLVVLLRAEGHGATRCSRNLDVIAREIARPPVHPDRRRLPAGDGRLAGDGSRRSAATCRAC